MFSRLLNRLEETLIACLMAGATLLIFVSVLQRYSTSLTIQLSKWATVHGLVWLASGSKTIFNWLLTIDLSWSQELCIFMFVWMAKFGAAYGVRTGVHVGVDIALNNLETRSRHRVILFGLLCGAFFTATVGLFGARFVLHMWQNGETSNDLEAPMWLVYLAIPCGTFLMCFRFLQVAYSFATTGQLPHTDESHVEGLEESNLLPHVGAEA